MKPIVRHWRRFGPSLYLGSGGNSRTDRASGVDDDAVGESFENLIGTLVLRLGILSTAYAVQGSGANDSANCRKLSEHKSTPW